MRMNRRCASARGLSCGGQHTGSPAIVRKRLSGDDRRRWPHEERRLRTERVVTPELDWRSGAHEHGLRAAKPDPSYTLAGS